jgi:hypothetical protein
VLSLWREKREISGLGKEPMQVTAKLTHFPGYSLQEENNFLTISFYEAAMGRSRAKQANTTNS